MNEEYKGVNLLELMFRLKSLNKIGIALSSEKDDTRLLELILEEAKSISFADGGTLFTRTDDDRLEFQIMMTDSINFYKGGSSGEPIPYRSLPIYNTKGQPNINTVAVCAALTGETINLPDAYEDTRFELSGTVMFDRKMNYRSKSFLAVPLKNHDGEVLGVLQLINAINPKTGEITTFSHFDQELVESLASQAAVALSNQRLLEGQRRLFEGFIKLIAKAIDDKSKYTSGHCQRVPVLTMMLADAAAKIQTGPLKNFSMDKEKRYELNVAGMLHDCGKITVPEYVIDKETKLHTMHDRISEIDTRFEVLKRDTEITLLQEKVETLLLGEKVEPDIVRAELAQQIKSAHDMLNEERDFLRKANVGGEFMKEEAQDRVRLISEKHRWINPEDELIPLLTEEEIYNLTIPKGTLTKEERTVINRHIDTTIAMLESLPYPKNLQSVPEYAGGHHECMDGRGYPKGLTRDQLSIPARVMGIADIFEALTAQDRPYKKPMSLSVALTILGKMKLDNHIDPDLFDVFIHEKVYLKYAYRYLSPDQIDMDEESVKTIPGYNPLPEEDMDETST